ncbi:MAG: hypothetical protein PT934_06800 [Peptoniphilaceae bacterium]|uniref:hypothetical protein n=1 Tax=Parvimonas sp. TaxID=1944660 RepID=UPI0025CDA73A|nr:hypothetical protein [Parvimonas sp.]MCI5997081.1 hypothetical protein [Parvimonas sp.]MDD7765458.1 hypothetical protein [Peptoniphilaceae bacterium]MDY3050999.1 hypothetical protein [Parvimonas sp.]
MLKFVLGPSGSGKTKWLIDQANEDKKGGNGNIVFVDTDDSHIFSLDHCVRLINAKEYGVDSLDKLFGFIFGIVSRDYDVEKIYLDGIYSIVDMDCDALCKFKDEVDAFCEKHNLQVFMGISIPKEKLCKHALESCVELKVD